MEIPSLTKTWRNASYPAISPTNPALSVADKTVFVTGGSVGIGLATAHAFVVAGASAVAISGRTEKSLLAAKQDIESAHKGAKVLTFVADVTDQKAMKDAFATLGKVDILIQNAAYLPDLAPVSKAHLADWWSTFEINVKGAFIVTQEFLRVASTQAIIVDVTTAASFVSPPWLDSSGYVSSKMGEHKFFDCVQAENPSLHVVHVHPGLVRTNMSKKAIDDGAQLPFDNVDLPASFIVWLCSPEARFLKGKSVFANWDVGEMKACKADIEGSGGMLTTTLAGMLSFKYTNNSSK